MRKLNLGGLLFYGVLPLFYLISLLPFFILFLFSDFLFFITFYLLRYRRKVVYQNLKNSFPEKTEKEIRIIEKKFYRFFCDLILEMLKLLTISKKELARRFTFTPNTLTVFNRFKEEGRSSIFVLGHCGNWEWCGNAFSLLKLQQLYAIYHPLTNPQFDRFMYRMRTRFGMKLYAMKDSFKSMVQNRHEVNITAFIADQTPPPDRAYWTTFLNQMTPVFWGTEKMAVRMNLPVIFVNIRRVKRGFYVADAEIITETPMTTKEGEITEWHVKKLEQNIHAQPEIWLWTHRRWKHKPPVEKALIS